MTTQRKLTRPGMNDNEWAAVTCTPEATAVEFFEFDGEAESAARDNLHPTTSTFVCKVVKQGEHAIRGTAQHHAVLVEVDDELRRALAYYHDAKGRPRREVVAGWVKGILDRHLALIRSDYRQSVDGEVTQTGRAPTQCSRCGQPESPTCCAKPPIRWDREDGMEAFGDPGAAFRTGKSRP